MTFEEIERLAYEGKPIDRKCDPHEKLLYGAMVGLYAQYRNKQINRNMARQQKLEWKRDFEQAQWLHEKQVEAYNRYQFNILLAAGSLCAMEHAIANQPDREVLDLAFKYIQATCGQHDYYRRHTEIREKYYGRQEI